MDKQTIGLKRKTSDKYYTSQYVVDICINLVKENIDIHENNLCIEPSAGNGAFINGIKSLFKNYIFYDIESENNNEIIPLNYLLFDCNYGDIYEHIHIIGNPPFGRQSSMAMKFITISSQFCDSISFILPKSFKKNSLKRHFPLNFHLKCEYDLPYNSFIINEKNYNVPCVFQIWIKRRK